MGAVLWLWVHLGDIFAALAAVHAAAVAVVNLTPTPKDDEFVERVYRWVELAAGLIHPRSKQ